MLSVIIATQNAERPLVRTLAALVPGAMAGLVTDVVIASRGADEATAKVADAAGCEFFAADETQGALLSRAVHRARAQWLMFLPPGVVLETPWIEETTRFLQDASLDDDGLDRIGIFRSAGSRYARPKLRTLALNAVRFLGGATPQQGLIIHRALYQRVGGHQAGSKKPEMDLLARLGKRQRYTLKANALRPEG